MAAQPPVLTIRRKFPRLTKEQSAAFHSAPTGFVVDARGRQGALDFRIKPLTTKMRFCGTALAVTSRPRDNLAAWAALEVAQPGDVVIITTRAYEEAAVIGDNYVAMAKNCGVVAVVTDGMARDLPGIEDVGIPVFARGLTPNSPFKDGPGDAGLRISIGGVAVSSGDLLVGDQDGVVVVPLAEIDETIEALVEVAKKEAGMERCIREGAHAPEWLAATLAQKGVRYVD